MPQVSATTSGDGAPAGDTSERPAPAPGRPWPARVEAAARLRHLAGQVVSAVVIAVAVFFLALVVLSLFYASRSLPEFIRLESAYRAGEISWQEYLMASQHLNVVLQFIGLYLALFVLPFIIALIVAGGVVMLWRDPPRIVVLRPFNRRPLSRDLAALVRRDVARFGHVYTLADADLRVRWYVRVPLLLGQLALLSFRARIIRKDRQLPRLARATHRTWLRNINWCLSRNKVFPVATDDHHWQQVVRLLLQDATVILVDLTEARPNVRWEIALIDRLGLTRRVLWLLREGDSADTLPAAGADPATGALFRYGAQGRTARAGLRAAIAGRVAGAREAAAPALRRGRAISMSALAMFATGCLPLLALWFEGSAEDMSRTLVRGESLSYWTVVFGLLTLGVLGIATIRNRNAIFFVAVQLVLLAGAVIQGG